ncbi:MAG TPA: hypothetical protein VM013_07670, partial [Dehalococcoidia bacterium]|nr:hypothetical protein [Dehalococcoidia bacterium]
PECDLSVSKSDSPTTVGEGGEITYTITVTNEGEESGDCTDLTVVDAIPSDTDCVSATDDGSLDFDIDGCDSSGDVVWDTNDNLDDGEDVVLTMVVELTSGADEDETISNTACATSSDDEVGDCDTERTNVGEPATATPQPTATAQPTISIPTIAPPPPIIAPLPTLSPPVTGTGTDGGSSSGPLAIGLGLAGLCLMLVSGATLVKRTR